MGSVGVVVPCYRYGHLLERCLRSILDQPGVDVRVLVIDDASPDDSAERAHELAAADPRVEVRVHEANRGHISTFNEGVLGWSAGELGADYTLLISADDRLTPGSLTRSVAFLDHHPEIGFVYGRHARFSDDAALPAVSSVVRDRVVYDGDWWLRRRFAAGTGCIASPEAVVRTSVQVEIGGYDPDLPHTSDIEMWLRFAARGPIGFLAGCDQAYYRVGAQNMSSAYSADAGIGDLRQRRAAFLSVLAKDGHLLPDPDRLESVVRRKLAGDALWRASRAYDRRRVGSDPVDELVEFAEETWPDAHALPQYAGLRLRRRVGPAVMPYLQPLVLTAVTRKLRRDYWWWNWRRTGV